MPPGGYDLLTSQQATTVTVGVVGPQGADGPQGATGASGPAGVNGATGPAGINGATGPIGITGATGVIGPTGVAGPTGPVGVTGATGPSGIGSVLVDATTANTIYVGIAPNNASQSSAVWTITKTVFSSAGIRTSKLQAVGVTWTGRTGHTYS